MKISTISIFIALLTSMASFAQEQASLERILRKSGVNYGKEAERAVVVRQLKVAEEEVREKVAAKAKKMGIPIVVNDGKQELRLIGFNGDKPRYEVDRMVNAAISSNARALQSSLYGLDGSGWTVGIWETRVPRITHQEFNTGPVSRITVLDGSTTASEHATHVAGIIASAGVSSSARGIANEITVNSHNTSNLYSEITNLSASASGQKATKVYVSNHSYGIVGGWGTSKKWNGVGTDQNAVDPDLGLYSNICVLIDGVIVNNPYHLLFWACGNERGSQPVNGDDVTLGGNTVTYDSAIHPPSNTVYKNGYDTVPGRALAKNLMAVGATDDAVSNGVRDPGAASVASFSSWGPADDGRIKPDLVANGVAVYSTFETSDTAYGSLQGTSMSTPNACGTAALIVEQYGELFSGASMAASTLKGLMIHTADDIGRAGPDYINGWGLVNGRGAVDHLIDHQANPLRQLLTEDQIISADTSKIMTFDWNGLSEIRATLCWTDPVGAAKTSVDDRSPDLVNDLNLKIIAPDGTEYFPFVMPYVGDWSDAALDDLATTGVNIVDNVEQVLVNAPGQAGTWTVEVTYAGSLSGSLQDYGLILSGAGGLTANSSSVFSPNGAESIAIGSSYEVTWASNVAGNVKVDLLKGGAFHATLSANEPNDGRYSWNVSPGITPGSDYTIQISSVNDALNLDVSDRDFVIVPTPSLETGLDTTGISWSTSGNGDWFQQSNVTKDGIDSGQSGDINNGRSSSLAATLVGPGTLTFWWRVSSEKPFDQLRFYLNNSEQTGSLGKISGEEDWELKSVPIAAGSQTVRWTYSKDSSVGQGSDAAWVDLVVFTPELAPDIAIAQPLGNDLTDDGSAIDFGGLPVGNSSSPLTFTITNAGTDTLTGLGLSKGGSNGGDFTLGSLGATTLAAGASTTFSATFSPGAEGSRSAVIQVASNDPDENPFEINVTGNGLPEGVLSLTAGDLTASGEVGGLFSPNSLTYTVTNGGSTTMSWTAAKTQPWTTLSSSGGTLAPGASAAVTVSINSAANALAVNSYSDTLTFTNTSNGLGNTTRDVFLTVQPLNFNLALIYEPFDDADSTLSGNSSGDGLLGAWAGTGGITAGSLNFGDLPLGSGNRATVNNQNGYVSTGSVLTDEGLLADGAELWFSALVRTGGDVNVNGDLGFAFGTERINKGNNLPVADSGTALGFTFKNNELRASHWATDLTRSTTNSSNGVGPDALYLVVGKFTWGASSETLEIYNIPTDLTLGAPVSTYTTPTNLNQADFDIISFASKSATPGHFFDEIRFGASYDSVVGLAGPSVDHFAISAISSPQVVGTPITNITITAQDAADNTVTDFTGTVTFGGSAGVTGTSVSFTAGELTGVSVTPLNIGSNLTLTVDDGAGHAGSANVTVISVYEAWSGETFANPFTSNTEPEDGDDDSLTNLQEFGFGMDPTDGMMDLLTYQVNGDVTQSGPPMSLVTFDAFGQISEIRAVFIRRKDHALAGLTYTVEFSADLASWTVNGIMPERLTGENSAGDLEVMAVTLPATVPLQGGGSAVPTYFKVGISQN